MFTEATYIAGNGVHRGYVAATNPTGDKTFFSVEGTTEVTPKPGGPPDMRAEGKFSYTGGTGNFEGITGAET